MNADALQQLIINNDVAALGAYLDANLGMIEHVFRFNYTLGDRIIPMNFTLLQEAVRKKKPEIVFLLLEKGADVDNYEESLTPPIFYAIYDEECFFNLYYEHASLEEDNAFGETLQQVMRQEEGNPNVPEAVRQQIYDYFGRFGNATNENNEMEEGNGNFQEGLAFQIHNAFNRINKPAYSAFIERQIPAISGQPLQNALALSNRDFGEYILRTMNELKETLPEPNKATVTGHIGQFANLLRYVAYTDAEKRRVIFYALEFAKRQPAEFQRFYIRNHTTDSATAYNGANPVSCIDGILERFVTTLGGASLIGDNAQSEVYEELRHVTHPVTLQDILTNYGGECSNAHPDNVEDFRRCIHEKALQELGAEYDIVGLNALMDTYIPQLHMYGGNRKNKHKLRKTRKSKKSKSLRSVSYKANRGKKIIRHTKKTQRKTRRNRA